MNRYKQKISDTNSSTYLGLRVAPVARTRFCHQNKWARGTTPRLSDSPRDARCCCGGMGIHGSIKCTVTWVLAIMRLLGLSHWSTALVSRKFSCYFAERGFVNPSCRPCPGVIDNVGANTSWFPNLKAKHHRCISKNNFLLVVFCASENAAFLSRVVIPFDFLTLHCKQGKNRQVSKPFLAPITSSNLHCANGMLSLS